MNIHPTRPIRILGVDPGTSTGLVVADYSHVTILPTFPLSTTTLYDSIIETLIEIIDHYNPDVVVVEDFAVRRSKALGLSTDRLEVVRVIGIVKAICHIKDKPFILQRPVDVTRAVVEPDIKRSLAHHERSAYKHIKYWYYTKYIKEQEQK